MKNPQLIKTIKILKAEYRNSGKRIWKRLAEEIDKPKRRRNRVNISKINRNTKSGDLVVIPGKVLAAGSISHPLTVAAFSFSEGARKKILAAEGRALSLEKLAAEKTDTYKVKILK
jgi:large subunit ribosomal protein L18e